MTAINVNISISGEELALDKLESLTFDKLHKFIDTAYNELMTSTPVDSGTARESWDVAENDAGIKEIEYGNYGLPNLPSYNRKSESLTIGTRSQYMEALNEGHSKQAPSLFIEAALQRAADSIE